MAQILKEFGGVRPLARALGRSQTSSTVQYWKKTDRLSRAASAEVMQALIDRGIAPKRAQKMVTQAIIGTDIQQSELAPAA